MSNFPTTAIETDANSRPGIAGHFPGNVGPYNIQVGTPVQDANGIWYAPLVTQFNAASAGVSLVNSANTGIPSAVPAIVQKKSAVSTGSVASLAATFNSANTAGNTIVVVAGCGNGTAMTVADSAGNTYTSAIQGANSTTFEAQIFYAVGIVSAASNVVTVTNAGSAASMAVQVYEVSGLLQQVVAQPDSSTSATGTSAAPVASALSPSVPNCLAFMGVGVGTAAQAVSVTSGTTWTLDSSQNTTTPAGLYTFGALSQALYSTNPVVPKATLAGSEPFALAAAVFKPVALAVAGTVVDAPWNYTNITSATTTQVKIGAGVLHLISVNTLVGSATIEFDDALSHTTPKIGTITLPGTITSALPTSMFYDIAFNTGLSITTSGATDITVAWR